MPLLHTALEGCHRQEALFQAEVVSYELHTSLTLTKPRYKDIVQIHTGIDIRSVSESNAPCEWTHTHLILLAPWPVLVEMT